jgi:hypothetical protein
MELFTIFNVGFKIIWSVAPRELYHIFIIQSIFLPVFYTTPLYRQCAVCLQHSAVFLRALKLTQIIVIKELLDKTFSLALCMLNTE